MILSRSDKLTALAMGAIVILIVAAAFLLSGCSLINSWTKAGDATTATMTRIGSVATEIQTNDLKVVMGWMWQIQQNQNQLFDRLNKLAEHSTELVIGLTALAGACAAYLRWKIHQVHLTYGGKKK